MNRFNTSNINVSNTLTLSSAMLVVGFFLFKKLKSIVIAMTLIFIGVCAYGADGQDYYGNQNINIGGSFNTEGRAEAGSNGTDGTDGTPGSDQIPWVHIPTDGGNGSSGGNASSGGSAYGGVTFINSNFTANGITLEFLNTLANGGNGGNGGRGGNGGNGGNAKVWAVDGGDGGDGANAGDGADAGSASGGAIYVNMGATFNQSNILFSNSSSVGGNAGDAGKLGNKGKGGSDTGGWLNPAHSGSDGKDGNPSTRKNDGGNAYGGAMYINANTTFDQSTVTFEGNTAIGGKGSNGGSDGQGLGQAIYVDNKTLTFNGGTTIFGENYNDSGHTQSMIYVSGNNANVNFNGGKVIIASHTVTVNLINDPSKMTFNPVIMGFYYNGTVSGSNDFLIDFMKSDRINIWGADNIVAKNMEVVGNKADKGGFLRLNQTVTFNALGDVFENQARSNGGVFYLSAGSSMTINASKDITFSGNTANSNPNDIYLTNASLTLISNEKTMKILGGIQAVAGSSVSISAATAGKIYFSGINLFDNIGNLNIANNAIVTVDNATWIYSNNNTTNGMGLIGNAQINFSGNSRVVFSGNTGNVGGAIHLTGTSKMVFASGVNLDLKNNESKTGNGIILAEIGSTLDIMQANLTAIDNKAINGGVFYFNGVNPPDIYLNHIVEMSKNIAVSSGGAIYVGDGAELFIIANNNPTIFSGNRMFNGLNDIFVTNNSAINFQEKADATISLLSGIQIREQSKININVKTLFKLGGVNVFDELVSIIIGHDNIIEIENAKWTYSNNQTMSLIASNMTFTASTAIFRDNIGAIQLNDASILSFEASSISFFNNINTSNSGGAISINNRSILKISAGLGNVTFSGNTANNISNDIYVNDSTMTLIANSYQINIKSGIKAESNSVIVIEQSSGAGEVVLSGLNQFTAMKTFKIISGKMTVENATFTYVNSSTNTYLTGTSVLTFRSSSVTFANNSGTLGGAIHIENGTTVNIEARVNFSGNSSNQGGAIYNAGTLNLDSSSGDIIFRGNTVGAPLAGALNDIYTSGTINIDGNSNDVEMNGGIAGDVNAKIYKNNAGRLLLKGDSFGYVGSFKQTGGQVIVSSNYFSGKTDLSSGTLEFASGTKLSSHSSNFNIDIVSQNALLLITAQQGEENDITISRKNNITGNGLINKIGGGHLYIDGDNSGFTGSFTQYAGTTTINMSGKLFGGTNFIESSVLRIISDSIYYEVDISTGGTLIHYGSGQNNNTIEETYISFKGDNGKVIFTSLTQLKPRYMFSGVGESGIGNEVIFSSVNVALSRTTLNYPRTNIIIDNSRLDIRDIGNDHGIKTVNFDNLQAQNSSSLDFVLLFAPDALVPEFYTKLLSDKIIAQNGTGEFDLGNIRLNNLEFDGTYNPVFPFSLDPIDAATTTFVLYANDVLSRGLQFTQKSTVTIYGVNYNYIVTASSQNDVNGEFTGVRMDVKIGSPNRLYLANIAITGNVRTFYQYPGSYPSATKGITIGDYYIKQNMDKPNTQDGIGDDEYTHEGEIYIIGAKGAVEDIHIYAIVHSTDGLSPYEGQRSHLFELKAKGDTQITISHISISSASKNGWGSMLTMPESAHNLSAIFEDSIIGVNEALGARGYGGAVYSTTGTLRIAGSKFIQNSADLDGGAIYLTGSNITEIEDSIFENNSADRNGGAVFMNGVSMEIRAINGDTIFRANTAASNPNDIYMNGYSTMSVFAQKNRKVIINSGIRTTANDLVVKKGEGELQLAGQTNIAGTVNIENGDIRAMSNIKIHNLNIKQDGTFAMASSAAAVVTNADAVNIEGHYAVGVNVAKAQTDLLNVTGTIIIDEDATLSVKLYSYGENIIVRIIQASGVTGEFGDYRDGNTWERIQPGVKRKYEVIYGANYVDLSIDTRTDFKDEILNLSHNQREVSRILDSINEINVGEKLKDPIVNALFVGNNQLAQRYLDEMSGEFLVNAITLAAVVNNAAIFERMNGKTADEKIKPYTYEGYVEASKGETPKKLVWMRANINGNTFEDKENKQGKFKSNGIGLLVGIDLLEKNSLWQKDNLRKTDKMGGVFIGINQKSLEQGYGSADMTDLEFGLYGGMFSQKIDVKVAVSAGFQSYDTQRDLKFSGLKPQAQFNTQSIKAEVEVSYLIDTIKKGLDFKPFVGFRGGHVLNKKITESKGDVADLIIDANEYNRLSGQIGAKISNTRDGFSKFDWYGKIYMGVLIVGNIPKYDISLRSNEEYGKMDIWGADEGIVSAGFGAGAKYEVTKNMSIFTNADFNIGTDISAYYVGVGVNYRFEKKAKTFEMFTIIAEHFDFDKYDLKKGGKETIETASQRIKNSNYKIVVIKGHTDSTGSQEYNMGLSQRRAKTVYDELKKNELKADKLRYEGYGESLPIATNETEKGRALNRRVEIVVE